jgi:hypothetical protein
MVFQNSLLFFLSKAKFAGLKKCPQDRGGLEIIRVWKWGVLTIDRFIYSSRLQVMNEAIMIIPLIKIRKNWVACSI